MSPNNFMEMQKQTWIKMTQFLGALCLLTQGILDVITHRFCLSTIKFAHGSKDHIVNVKENLRASPAEASKLRPSNIIYMSNSKK
jgi:hypothetical protein